MAKKSTTEATEVKTPQSKFGIIARVNAIFDKQPKEGINIGISPLSESALQTQKLSAFEQRQADRIASGNGAGTVGESPFEEFTKIYANKPDVMQQLKALKAGTLCAFTCTQEYNKFFAPAKNEWVEDWNIYCSAVTILPNMETAKQDLAALVEAGEARRFIPRIKEKNKPATKPQTSAIQSFKNAIADAF